jgi:hypothetical protein
VPRPEGGDEEDNHKGAAMTNFLLLARGASIATARVVAVSADQALISKFIQELADGSARMETWAGREPVKCLRPVQSGDEEES